MYVKIEKVAKSCNIKFLETAQNIELHIIWVLGILLGSCKKKLQKLALVIIYTIVLKLDMPLRKMQYLIPFHKVKLHSNITVPVYQIQRNRGAHRQQHVMERLRLRSLSPAIIFGCWKVVCKFHGRCHLRPVDILTLYIFQAIKVFFRSTPHSALNWQYPQTRAKEPKTKFNIAIF